MYRTLKALYPQDTDLPARAHTMLVRHAVLDGELYDVLAHEFHEERNEMGEYIPMAQRAPAVRHGLCRTVVNDSVSLLFSEGRFPEIDTDAEATREGLATLMKDASFNHGMITAATMGSAGSVAILLRVLSSRLRLAPMRTTYLTPTFEDDDPDRVVSVREKYKVKGRALRDRGYSIAKEDESADYWFQRDWNATDEIWYVPWKVHATGGVARIDSERSVTHALGFCPIVWVRNLPGGDDIDGMSTFDPHGVENQIEMDYQMSQGGRGLKYTSSPTLVIETDDMTVKSNKHVVGDALVVPTGGKAHHLEISGAAVAAVIEYCEYIRKITLESLGGARSDPDKLSAAQSGRAMEMLNQSLIWLADKLRTSYGEGALLAVARMAMSINQRIPLVDRDGEAIGKLDVKAKLSLKWSPWYPPTYTDQQTQATAITTLRDGALLSTETAIGIIAPTYDIEDAAKELAKIHADKDGEAAREVKKEVDTAKGTRPFEYQAKK